jgi:hypothetical protein
MGIIKNDSWISSQDDDDTMYISTTRMKFGGTGYPTQLWDDKNIVRIVFDGRVLNSKFKITPVDKMKGKKMSLKSSYPDGVFDLYKSEILKQGNVEAEDRVIVNSQEIPNVHKYIKSIHVSLDNLDNKYIQPFRDYCKKFNIELREYNTTNEFNLGR